MAKARRERTTNPAQRLLEILEQVREPKYRDSEAIDVWKHVLHVRSKGLTSTLLERLGQVMRFPSIVESLLSKEDGINHETYLKIWQPQVESAFSSMTFTGRISNFNKLIDSTALAGLEICSDLLARKNEKVMPEDELKALMQEIVALIEEIMLAHLESDLKHYMLEKLEMVRSALQQYRLMGIGPLERVAESTLGSVHLHREICTRVEGTKFGKRFWKIMGRTVLIVALAKGVIELGEKIPKFLLPESQQSVEQKPSPKCKGK